MLVSDEWQHLMVVFAYEFELLSGKHLQADPYTPLGGPVCNRSKWSSLIIIISSTNCPIAIWWVLKKFWKYILSYHPNFMLVKLLTMSDKFRESRYSHLVFYQLCAIFPLTTLPWTSFTLAAAQGQQLVPNQQEDWQEPSMTDITLKFYLLWVAVFVTSLWITPWKTNTGVQRAENKQAYFLCSQEMSFHLKGGNWL